MLSVKVQLAGSTCAPTMAWPAAARARGQVTLVQTVSLTSTRGVLGLPSSQNSGTPEGEGQPAGVAVKASEPHVSTAGRSDPSLCWSPRSTYSQGWVQVAHGEGSGVLESLGTAAGTVQPTVTHSTGQPHTDPSARWPCPLGSRVGQPTSITELSRRRKEGIEGELRGDTKLRVNPGKWESK